MYLLTYLLKIANVSVISRHAGQEVDSSYGSCLSGDVRCGGNLEKVGDNIYAKRDAMQYLDCTALRLRTFVIHFHIPEVELECRISVFWLVLSGDVHIRRNIEKVGKIVYAKRDATFSHWIALHLCCRRLALIFGKPEMELQCGFMMCRRVLDEDVYFR